LATFNPILKKLGLSANDRAVVLHADDIGNLQSTLDAYGELLDAGVMSSAAVMVPCPWFPATAEFVRANAGHPHLDMGVHLTTTSEYASYRWGPLTTRDTESGLLDEDGYMPGTSAAFQGQATVEAVRVELRAQIRRALAAGIDVTHIDSHMGSVFHWKFIETYVDLALEYEVPAFLPRAVDFFLFEEAHDLLLARIPEWEERGLPLFDYATMMPLDDAADRTGHFLRTLQSLPPGLSYLIFHPTKDTPELRQVSPVDWPCRAADYETFRHPDLRDAVQATGVHVVAMRDLRDLLRSGGSA
jgi:hypothetical protein